jgi:hypothetical protein
VEPDERVEDEQARLELGHRLVEAGAVGVEIEPQGRRGDDLDVERGELDVESCEVASSIAGRKNVFILVRSLPGEQNVLGWAVYPGN